MAATHVVGRRQYSTRSDRIITNVLQTILLLNRDIRSAGFITFFSRVPTMRTQTEEFEWDTDEFLEITDTTDGSATAAATTISVDNPRYFIPGQLWMNTRTGEVFRVDSVNNSTKNLTVTRAVTALNSGGGTAAAAMNDADTLAKLGPAVGEDNRRQSTQTTTPTTVTNYSQAMRWELEMSRRQIKRQFEQGPERDYLLRKRLLEARMDLNRTFLFGEKGRYTDDTEGDVTLTKGIRSVPSTYTFAVGGTLYEATFDDWLVNEGLRDGNANKVLFASTDVLLAITEMTKDRLQYSPGSMNIGGQRVGLQVMEYMAPNGGRIMLVEDRAISQVFPGEAYLVDMEQLRRMIYSNNGIDDDLHVIDDTSDNDDLGRVSTLYGDMGLRYGLEQTHGKMSGVSGGAKGRALS